MDIAYATRTIDAVPANEEDAALLKIQVGAPLLRVRGRAFTLDGVPIEASDDRYLASEANFSVTTARGNASPISLQEGGWGAVSEGRISKRLCEKRGF